MAESDASEEFCLAVRFGVDLPDKCANEPAIPVIDRGVSGHRRYEQRFDWPRTILIASSGMSATLEYSEAAIFSRLIEAEQDDLSPELARHILSLQLSPKDQRRIDALLAMLNEGALNSDDRLELENLNHIADLISLWHSKARRVLSITTG